MKSKYLLNRLPLLEEYIGGLQGGDSILFITSFENELRPVISAIIENLNENKFSIIYLGYDISFKEKISTFPNSHVIDLSSSKTSSANVISSVKRFFTKHRKKTCLVIDDISPARRLAPNFSGLARTPPDRLTPVRRAGTWSIGSGGSFTPFLKNEKKILSFYSEIIDTVKKKNALLVSTVISSKLSNDSIGVLKDLASITIDTVLQSGTIHGSLLNRKNKYIPSRLTPLRMDLKFLSSVKNLENVVSTKNQTDWKNVFSSDAVFRKSFMDTGEPMILFELNGEYKLPNKRLLELLGFTEDEFQKMKLIDFFPDNKKFAALRFYTSLKSKRRHTFNTLLKKRSGKLMPVEISVSSLTEGLYFGIIRDVTKQIEIEDLLKKEEEKYRHILEASSNAIVLYDDTTPIYANLRFLKMVGCESSDLESYNLKKIFSQKDQREIKRINKNIFLNELTYGLRPRRGLVESCQQNNQPYSAEFRLIKHDQTTADCEITFSTVRYGKKKILQLNILDITSQKRFIAELQRSEEKFKLLVESSPLSISLTKDDKFSYCNSAFLKLFGYDSYEKILGQEKFVIGFKNNLERERKPKQTQVQSFRFTGTIRPYGRTDGSTIPVEAVVLRITLHNEEAEIVFYRDISEQIQIEEDLKLRKKDYQLLDRIISQVTQSLDTKEISDTSLKTILYNLGWDCGAVFIRVNNNLSLQTSQGFSEHVAEKLKMLS
ncbi:MAG: PAS domain S-box protein, partial [Bacteroidetes bacterium]|nr:PAS domain S-box protein [Bacteroidota bacterium]